MSEKGIILLGISFHKADVEMRGYFSLDTTKGDLLLNNIKHKGGESLYYSTCNRTELLTYGLDDHEALEQLLLVTGRTKADFEEAGGYILHDEAAIEHLFSVAAGLHSLVLGDMQISGQVLKAYNHACTLQTVGAHLHRLMQHIRKSTKKIRTETDLCRGAASVAHAAVLYLKQKTTARNILLVGAGKMGSITAMNLASDPRNNIAIINRTEERSEKLAAKWAAASFPWEQLNEKIAWADAIIVSTAAQEPVITPEMLPESKKLVLIDLSMPSNIDPSVADKADIQLVTLDQLNAVTDVTYEQRRKAIPLAEEIIAHQKLLFYKWMKAYQARPIVDGLRSKLDEIKLNQVKYLKDLNMNEEQYQKVLMAMESVTEKIAGAAMRYVRKHDDPNTASEIVSEMFEINNAD